VSHSMADVTGCPRGAGFLCDKSVVLRGMVKGAPAFMFSPVKLTSSEYTTS